MQVTVLFPVSVEDPIALDRKSVVLDESFMDSGKRPAAGAGAPVRCVWDACAVGFSGRHEA